MVGVHAFRSSSIYVLRRYVVMYNLVHSVDTSH